MSEGEAGTDTNQGSAGAEIRDPNLLFTEEEVRSMVKDFVMSLATGRIKINSKTSLEFESEAAADGNKISLEQGIKMERDQIKEFMNWVDICSDVRPAKPEERRLAVRALYNRLLNLRLVKRIEGTLYGLELEERVSRLEDRLTEICQLVNESIQYDKQGRPPQ